MDLNRSFRHVNFRVGTFRFLLYESLCQIYRSDDTGDGKINTAFLNRSVEAALLAWFLFMIRFYLMPLILGYDVMGMLSFPLESDAALIIYDLGKIFR